MGKIISLMRLCLQKKEIPLSWGISNIRTSKNEVSFKVYASKYQGGIKISENEENLILRIRDRIIPFNSPTELFYWLDNFIE